MSEIKLFNLATGKAKEIPGKADGLEKSLQTLFENNLDTFIGVRFIVSEHLTGKIHGGRVDTLGIDENGCPVIIEYKRSISENVVSQGLYYLDWLLDHKAEFKLLVIEIYDDKVAESIDWSAPRLVCIAADFTKFDEHAIRQINRNIDLIRYRRFGSELLALELASRVSTENLEPDIPNKTKITGKKSGDKLVSQALVEMDDDMRDLYESLRSFILALGDDVIEKHLKLYIAYRRIKNFVSVCVLKKGLCIYLNLDPDKVNIDKKYMRDVREVGHWGTGSLEFWITDKETLKLAEPFILKSYEGT